MIIVEFQGIYNVTMRAEQVEFSPKDHVLAPGMLIPIVN
jgi:hypothetical protein